MRFLIISDTHGSLTEAAMVIELWHKRVDGVWHLGDHESDAAELAKLYQVPFRLAFQSVPGNCDFGSRSPSFRTIPVEGHTVFMCHGQYYGVDDPPGYLPVKARETKADVVLFGHTHEPYQEEQDGVLYLNPGSIARPRGGSEKSFAILELEKGRKAAAVIIPYDEIGI